MSYVIGFDLGTHQTKICVQDTTNPAEKTYEFFRFRMPDGTSTFLFPSIVQINKDHTVSYGLANEEECLITGNTSEPEPILQLLEEPSPLILPKFQAPASFPPKPKFDKWLDNLRKLKGEKTELDKWNEQCEAIKKEAHKKWESTCKNLQTEYNRRLSEIQNKNTAIKADYTKKLEKWEEDSKQQKQIFRYFKLHALTGSGRWEYKSFSSKEISVWYIAYILLLLREKYGEDVIIQFGVPCGASDSLRDKIITKKTYEIYIAAADLSSHFDTIEDYLASTYEELQSLTLYQTVTNDIINQYYFDDIPEAFAGLVAVTLQKKLGTGFHLLVDIGGGTTDLALFCVSRNYSPDVLYVTSFASGINAILMDAQSTNPLGLDVLQAKFLAKTSHISFINPIRKYKNKLITEGKNIVRIIETSFSNSFYHHGRKLTELKNALKDQPVIYGGGGGSFKELHTKVENFTDIRKIDRSMLSIRNLITSGIDNKLFTILATSYGLASFEKPYNEGIKCTDISVAFQTFLPEKYPNRPIYEKYEHGISDT